MALTLLERFGQMFTDAGWKITTTGKFNPNNDGTTAFLQGVGIVDPNTPANVLKPNADGSLNVTVSGGGGEQNVNLNQVGGSAIAIGSAASAASLPVVIASDQAAINVTPDSTQDGVTVNGTTTGVGTVITFTAAQLRGMDYIAFGFTAAGATATVAVGQAPDGATFNGASTFWRTDTTGLASGQSAAPILSQASITTAMQFVTPITAPVMRIQITAGTGTITCFATPKRGSIPMPQALIVSATNTAGPGASGVALTGNPVRIGISDGTNTQNLLQTTAAAANGNTGQGVVSVEEAGRTFSNITTATTTTVKSGKGFLHTLTVNTFVASATITIYDSLTATGTKIGTITLPSTITSDAPFYLTYDLAYQTGLTIVTSQATDLTVTWR